MESEILDIKQFKFELHDQVKAIAQFGKIVAGDNGVITNIFRNGPVKYYDVYIPKKGVTRLSGNKLVQVFTFSGEKATLWKELEEAHSRGEYPEWTLDSPLSTEARPFRLLTYLYNAKTWVSKRYLQTIERDALGRRIWDSKDSPRRLIQLGFIDKLREPEVQFQISNRGLVYVDWMSKLVNKSKSEEHVEPMQKFVKASYSDVEILSEKAVNDIIDDIIYGGYLIPRKPEIGPYKLLDFINHCVTTVYPNLSEKQNKQVMTEFKNLLKTSIF